MISCSQVQAALSARLDGESSPLADDVIDAHLTGCADCRRFLEQAAVINRQLAFSDPAKTVDIQIPDLADQILAGVEPTWRRERANRAVAMVFARVGLGFLAVVWFLWAARMLGDTSDLEPLYTHIVVEAAAMRCALGFGLAFTAWLPRVAKGILPLYGALLMFSFGFGVRDMVLGVSSTDSFMQLGLLFVSVLLLGWLWLLDQGWALVASLGAQPAP